MIVNVMNNFREVVWPILAGVNGVSPPGVSKFDKKGLNCLFSIIVVPILLCARLFTGWAIDNLRISHNASGMGANIWVLVT